MMSLNVTEAPLFSLRGINVNLRHNLIEVKPESKEAVFQHLDTQETVCIKTIKKQILSRIKQSGDSAI